MSSTRAQIHAPGDLASPVLVQQPGPWRRPGLQIPPDSIRAWVRLGTCEFGMGVLVYVVFGFGTQLTFTVFQ